MEAFLVLKFIIHLKSGLIKLLFTKDQNSGDLWLHSEVCKLGNNCAIVLESKMFLFMLAQLLTYIRRQ